MSCFFPSTRGVVEFIAHDGSTVLLAATGHIRSFIGSRLNESAESTAKANLGPITAKIVCWPTGSAFESDWIVHERARVVDPELSTKLNDQNQRALLVLDRASGTWRVDDTQRLQFHPDDCVIGPILTKKAAIALGEALDDVFELCRFPKELAQAPVGSPCAYKQMGRCPGACDGSESIAAYMQRFELVIQTASGGVAQWKQHLRSQIEHASADLDFEIAQIASRQLEEVNKLPVDALGLAMQMHELSCVCITPCVRKGWAMIWVLGDDENHDGQDDGQGVGLIPIMGIEEYTPEIERCIERNQSPLGLTEIELDRFALIARHWMTKPSRAKRRRVSILDLRTDDWKQKIAHAIAQSCVPTDPGHEDEEHTHIKGLQ